MASTWVRADRESGIKIHRREGKLTGLKVMALDEILRVTVKQSQCIS